MESYRPRKTGVLKAILERYFKTRERFASRVSFLFLRWLRCLPLRGFFRHAPGTWPVNSSGPVANPWLFSLEALANKVIAERIGTAIWIGLWFQINSRLSIIWRKNSAYIFTLETVWSGLIQLYSSSITIFHFSPISAAAFQPMRHFSPPLSVDEYLHPWYQHKEILWLRARVCFPLLKWNNYTCRVQ